MPISWHSNNLLQGRKQFGISLMDVVPRVTPAWCPDVLAVPDSGSWTSECGTCSSRVPPRRCLGRRRSPGRVWPSAVCVSASRCGAVVRCRREVVECSLVDTAPWDNCILYTRELSTPTATSVPTTSSSSSSAAAAASQAAVAAAALSPVHQPYWQSRFCF